MDNSCYYVLLILNLFRKNNVAHSHNTRTLNGYHISSSTSSNVMSYCIHTWNKIQTYGFNLIILGQFKHITYNKHRHITSLLYFLLKIPKYLIMNSKRDVCIKLLKCVPLFLGITGDAGPTASSFVLHRCICVSIILITSCTSVCIVDEICEVLY